MTEIMWSTKPGLAQKKIYHLYFHGKSLPTPGVWSLTLSSFEITF